MAQSDPAGRLMGRVTEAKGLPLAGATLYITAAGATQAAISNAQGYYALLSVPAGEYKLKVSKRGLAPWETKVNVASNLTSRIDVKMQGEGGELVAAVQTETKPEPKSLLAAAKPETVRPVEAVKPKLASSVANTTATDAPVISMRKADDEALQRLAEESEVAADPNRIAGLEREVDIEGGVAAVYEKIKYPELAFKSRTEGKVVARVLVSKRGEVISVDFVKSVNPMLDEEVFRVLTEETKFIPALAAGTPVPSTIVIPVAFKVK
ncbi:MAG: TonB family protein [Rhizobacter sp.]|nr:TonB family protein [Chlorobiales bacterium]